MVVIKTDCLKFDGLIDFKLASTFKLINLELIHSSNFTY